MKKKEEAKNACSLEYLYVFEYQWKRHEIKT